MCFILLQCKDKPSFIPPTPNNSIVIDHLGTSNMVDSMKIIYNSAVFNKQSFESDKALAIMVEKVNSNQIKPELQNFIDFALLQLQAGKLEESIATFNQIFGFSKSLKEINNNNKDLYEMMCAPGVTCTATPAAGKEDLKVGSKLNTSFVTRPDS